MSAVVVNVIWRKRNEERGKGIATLFHELVHASALRFEKSGVFKRKPRPKDVSSGLASFDELMANSVSELGTAFLEAIVDQGTGAK